MNRIDVEPELRLLANNYNQAFPQRPILIVDKGWLYGVWVVGQHYASGHGYYGEFPGGFLKRIVALFPGAKKVLHAFSGVVGKSNFPNAEEYTLDINPQLSPDIVGRVETFSIPQRFGLIVADPPYTKEDAARYGYGMPNRRKSVVNLAEHLQEGGYLCWLDTLLPLWKKASLTLVGLIGVVQSANHRTRLLSIFKK